MRWNFLMQQRLRTKSLIVILLSASFFFFTPQNQMTANAELNSALIIKNIIDPLIKASRNAGFDGQVDPDQLSPPPFLWASKCGNKTLRALANDTKSACKFLTAIKKEISAAVCEEKKQSYQTLWHLTSHYNGYLFSESQAYYLEHKSNRLGLKTPFFQRAKKVLAVNKDRSHEPQKLRQVTRELENQQYEKARALIPDFAKLCAY